MSDTLRFNPPSGMNSLSIALLSGHSMCIHRVHPTDQLPGTEIPVRFRKEALAKGCAPVGVDIDEDEEQGDTKSDLILKAVEAVIDRNDSDEVDANGRPKLAAVKKQAGMNVTKVELDAAFDAFEKSLA
jgi:hypothetical protein